MRWEPKRAVKNQLMNALEARISRLKPWRVSKFKKPYNFSDFYFTSARRPLRGG
jgi:hypothetical protein